MERTLGIIKPDAVKKGVVGEIISTIEKEGFNIVAIKKIHLKEIEAKKFYEVHKDKPFYSPLVKFMTSGPSYVMVLEKEDAIKEWRRVMGVTDPQKASQGTLRRKYGSSVRENAVHGSDSPENAEKEISFFFSKVELL